MAFQHHSEGMSPELRKLFEKELDLRKRFVDQVEGRSKRSWSDGRAGATDEAMWCSLLDNIPTRNWS